MGISVISSYRGGCNFETVGLSRTIVRDIFPGVMSKISGIGLTGIEKKVRKIHEEAFSNENNVLPLGGIYRYRKNGETHQYHDTDAFPHFFCTYKFLQEVIHYFHC